jgi:hypothetical protein
MGDAQFSGSDEGDRLQVKLWRLIRTTAVISTVLWGEKDYDMAGFYIDTGKKSETNYIHFG